VPLYDFQCRDCGEAFEALARPGESARCPVCGATEVERRFGAFAGPFTVGLRGAAAKRSNAQRRAREEQRRERREQRTRQRSEERREPKGE
jgi:putative FmdB family regulatory protein